MDKLFTILIEAFCWFLIFLSPFLIFFIAAAIVYMNNEKNYAISIGLIILGAIIGILLAERIRLKQGTTEFMSKLRG